VFGGLSHSGGVWAHLCGWWARRRDANVCWVCYETLREHPEREIARIARFMGVPADAATVARVAACVEIKVLRRVRRVVLHAIDALPARWRGDARGRAAPGTRPPLAAGLIVGSAAGVIARAVNAGADAVADGSGEPPRRGFAIGFVWGTRHHAESAPAQDPDAKRLDQDRRLAVVHWLISTQVAARTSLAAMRAAGPKYDDHFVFHRLKGQIGIAGEHQASKVRTGAVGRGAALPASVRRMLEARWHDTVFRRTGLASYGDLRAVAEREAALAATPSATRSPRGSYDADGLAELAPPRPQATRGPSGSYDCGDFDEAPPAGPTPTRGLRGSYDDNSDFEDDIANLAPPDSPAPDSPIDRAIADARADIHERVEKRVSELGENAAELSDAADEDARAAPPPRPPPAPGDPYDWIPVEED
jgi:hypothetical protein